MTEFTRGFRLITTDGDTYDGALFPSGRGVILDQRGFITLTASVDVFTDEFPNARIEWADGDADPEELLRDALATAAPTTGRRFHLVRDVDPVGASGTGHVADGYVFPDGHAVVHWLGNRRTTTPHPEGIASVEEIHCTHGNTRIVWDDPEPQPGPRSGCEHCPDGHMSPEQGQPWGANLGPERDGDGQPVRIYVQRAGGAHVAESDAEWITGRLNRP